MTEPSGLAGVLASRLRALCGPEVEVAGARPLPDSLKGVTSPQV